MAHEEQSGPELRRIFQHILLLALATLLPAFDFSFFGWLTGSLPLLTFLLLYRFGMHVGNRMILTGASLVLITGLVFARFEPILISMSMVPSGYAIAYSALRHESPARAGLKGVAALAGCWLLLLGAFTAIQNVNPYTVFLESLDEGIAGALELYRQSDSISADTLVVLEASLHQMKTLLPLIMPSILAGVALLTIWIAMAAGNRIASLQTGRSPWPQYRFWRLPDRLVWLMIAAALIALVPAGIMKAGGINALVVGGLIYWFQGLAVFSFFLHKWNLPILLRAFLYVMVVFQSFGTVILFGTGLADVWLDFRKIRKPVDTESAKE